MKLNKDQFHFLYHGTEEEAADHIDTHGLEANSYGVVYGTTNFQRAAGVARQRAADTGNAPRMVEFWAHKGNTQQAPMRGHKDDYQHKGNIPSSQVHSIYELNEDD